MEKEKHGLCNCPNCATNDCQNADDTRLHGLAIAFLALLEASVKEGYDEQPLELAQFWMQQKALSGPVGEGAARLLGITLPQQNAPEHRTTAINNIGKEGERDV